MIPKILEGMVQPKIIITARRAEPEWETIRTTLEPILATLGWSWRQIEFKDWGPSKNTGRDVTSQGDVPPEVLRAIKAALLPPTPARK
jgi:hypothetical protein